MKKNPLENHSKTELNFQGILEHLFLNLKFAVTI